MERSKGSDEPLMMCVARAIVKMYIFLLSMLPMPCRRDKDG